LYRRGNWGRDFESDTRFTLLLQRRVGIPTSWCNRTIFTLGRSVRGNATTASMARMAVSTVSFIDGRGAEISRGGTTVRGCDGRGVEVFGE